MNAVAPVAINPGVSAGISPAQNASPAKVSVETLSGDAGDGAHFRAALERHMRPAAPVEQSGGNKVSLGDKMMGRATDLASELKKDQQYVSKALEQATRSADSMQLMKAMMALNDYQMRVQFVSKTAAKATSSLDQLTKLQ